MTAAFTRILSAPSDIKDPLVLQTRAVGAVVYDCFTALTPTLLSFIKENSITTLVSTTLGLLTAKYLTCMHPLSVYILHMQPNVPLPSLPFYISSTANALLAAQILASPSSSSSTSYLHTYNPLLDWYLTSIPWLSSTFPSVQTPSKDDLIAILQGHDPDMHMILTFSKQLIPSLPVSPTIHVLPPFAHDYIHPAFNASKSCPKLSVYLDKVLPTKPFAVSLGSINVNADDLPRITEAVFGGLQRAGVKKVLVLRGSGTAQLTKENVMDAELKDWAVQNVEECEEEVPFAWLLEKCDGLLCHGGAGTVATGLRSGVGVAVAPRQVDQFFWGELVEKYGLGKRVEGGLVGCTMEEVEKAVEGVLRADLKKNAMAYRDKSMKEKNGAEELVDLLEAEWGRTKVGENVEATRRI